MLDNLRKKKKEWEESSTLKERQERFFTTSSTEIDRLYTPLDIDHFDYAEDLSFPGQYPFVRGIHPTMYRGRLWTMRLFSGFGTAEETNQRYKYLLAHGNTGLSVAFDFPTLYGYDSDHAFAQGEVGRCGVAISSLEDMETLFNGIPLNQVTTSMTINGPAAVVWALYLVCAQNQGASLGEISGTIQNDILKEYIAQKTFIFPPEPSMKLIIDTFEFGSQKVPYWNTISISGYHIREAGSTAIQELAFTLADGREYVREAVKRGLNVDDFAPRLSFFFNCHNDFFEEIAKFRAARRIWAKIMKEEFGAKDRSCWLRFHTQTAGCSLSAQQPENNIVRTTIQALAAVLGGTQSLHTNSMDEALALPSEKAATIALRTQQIIAHESGVVNTIDPLGGSYFVEYMTDYMEEEVLKYFDRIETLGGVLPAIKKGFFQQEIARAAYEYQKQIDEKKRTVVGVNDFTSEEELAIPLLKVDPELEKKQVRRLQKLKKERNASKVEKVLRDVEKAAENGQENMMPYFMEAVKNHATLGEVCQVLREVYGEYEEPAIY
ncbi:MAG: methylmalonyl-CoA mutase family protein [Theionarchaea archaeon]|nr:methylmalonyl-CoA mutase family protein [Theionarchaea archaeon]MBU7022167.1 methylmalonyl-CoA mutase family protein [Theionarchaea archaeon]